MTDKNVTGPGASCGAGGCPICRGLWPSSGWGKGVVLIAALAALGLVIAFETMRSDVEKLKARYEGLKAAGEKDEAAKVMAEIVDYGDRCHREKRADEAVAVFEWVVAKEPKRGYAMSRLGTIARDRGQADKAVAWFKRAIEVDPMSAEHYWNLAHLYYFERKDYAACEENLKEAMKLAPVKSQYRLLYAFCAQEMKQPSDIVTKRYRDVVDAVAAQALILSRDELAPGGSVATVWKTATDRLAAFKDSYGRDRMKKLAAEAKKPEAREFAKMLLAEKP